MFFSGTEDDTMDGKPDFENMTYEEFLKTAKMEPTVSEDCPLFQAIQMIGGKWRMPIVYQLSKKESYRFGELVKTIRGITKTMLTTALREMEENGIVKREQYNEIPPHVEYSLTEKGRDLFPVFFALTKWWSKYY